MNSNILIERDMLYPTDNSLEPGSVHIKVYGPNDNEKIPVVIESKTNHSPLKYIDAIIEIIQCDIFDRLKIDVKKTVDIYILTGSELKAEYGNHKYIRINFATNGITVEGVEL